MPSGHCPMCGATYETPRITPNGPFCRFCLPRGDVVVLQAVQRRGFDRPPMRVRGSRAAQQSRPPRQAS